MSAIPAASANEGNWKVFEDRAECTIKGPGNKLYYVTIMKNSGADATNFKSMITNLFKMKEDTLLGLGKFYKVGDGNKLEWHLTGEFAKSEIVKVNGNEPKFTKTGFTTETVDPATGKPKEDDKNMKLFSQGLSSQILRDYLSKYRNNKETVVYIQNTPHASAASAKEADSKSAPSGFILPPKPTRSASVALPSEWQAKEKGVVERNFTVKFNDGSTRTIALRVENKQIDENALNSIATSLEEQFKTLQDIAKRLQPGKEINLSHLEFMPIKQKIAQKFGNEGFYSAWVKNANVQMKFVSETESPKSKEASSQAQSVSTRPQDSATPSATPPGTPPPPSSGTPTPPETPPRNESPPA